MDRAEPGDYAEKVYAGVLGKVIGVYTGKPIEGWSNEAIEKQLGEVWYYVHDRLNSTLICADDDISGTFTFLRAIEDHGAGRNVTSQQIGRTWLNYLVENQTVLWWGGIGVSTEHTAWLRLSSGIDAPASGSIALNGQTVAEQIGAQIFIDGFGMVAPGDPKLAARLAREAARVSHDGEAVYAAQAVAAMESAAFVESDMTALLDTGLSAMPADCLMARLHRDVRRWAERHGDDWRATLKQIQRRYGYDRFGGGCHVVPNHAVMVMAWAHAPDDFQKALMIANTAGWDTDCNAGNVGCLMGIKDGLDGIQRGADWQGPIADRLVIPTAEGTHGISDALLQADLVARIGRRVMGWKAPAVPKAAARFHFSQRGAQHGFLPDKEIATENRVHLEAPGDGLSIRFDHLAPGAAARVATPTFLLPDQLGLIGGGYSLAATPTIYSGQTLTTELLADSGEDLTARLYLRFYESGNEPEVWKRYRLRGYAQSQPVRLRPGRPTRLRWTIPATAGQPIAQIGVRIDGPTGGGGSVRMLWMDWSGRPRVRFEEALAAHVGMDAPLGWIASRTGICHALHHGPVRLTTPHGEGLMHTGSAMWTDYDVSARVIVRLADRAGLVARYGGLHRYLALVYDRSAGALQLVRQYDQRRQIIGSVKHDWDLNRSYDLRLSMHGQQAVGYVDGVQCVEGRIGKVQGRDVLCAGGIALFSDTGTVDFAQVRVD